MQHQFLMSAVAFIAPCSVQPHLQIRDITHTCGQVVRVMALSTMAFISIEQCDAKRIGKQLSKMDTLQKTVTEYRI